MRAITLAVAVLSVSVSADELTPFQKFATAYPERLPAIFGATVCIGRETKSAALTEIAKERKYARLGGMVDKEKLYELQQRVRWADEHAEADAKAIKTWKVKPLPCSSRLVREIITCKHDSDRCDAQLNMAVDFVQSYEDYQQ